MKRIFAMISILFLVGIFTIQAQNSTKFDKSINSKEVLVQYRGKAVDTLSTNKQTFSYTIENAGQSELKTKFISRWEIAVDSVSGTPAAVKFDFQRRGNIFTSWTTDSTMYFYGTQSDSTLIFYDDTAQPDPYRRVLVTYGSGFKVKVDWLSGLFLTN